MSVFVSALLLLLILWACFLFGGFLFGKPNAEGTRRMPRWTRIASSLMLALAGWIFYLAALDSALEGYVKLIALGMTFGFIGDLFMARLLPFGNRVAGGIIAFGIGHILYSIALIGYGNRFGLDDPWVRWGALLLWLTVGILGWYGMVYRSSQSGVLHWVALFYSLLLAGTAGLATGLAVQASLFWPLAAGAGLFFLSDLILASELFSGLRFRSIGDVVWLTYGPGQMLIVYSTALLLSNPVS